MPPPDERAHDDPDDPKSPGILVRGAPPRDGWIGLSFSFFSRNAVASPGGFDKDREEWRSLREILVGLRV